MLPSWGKLKNRKKTMLALPRTLQKAAFFSKGLFYKHIVICDLKLASCDKKLHFHSNNRYLTNTTRHQNISAKIKLKLHTKKKAKFLKFQLMKMSNQMHPKNSLPSSSVGLAHATQGTQTIDWKALWQTFTGAVGAGGQGKSSTFL